MHESHHGPGGIALPTILRVNAALDPGGGAVDFEDGTSWTRLDALQAAFGSGAVFREMGLSERDRVAIFLPNGADFLRAWWGAAIIGAVVVPISTAYRGELLAHVLHSATPTVIVTNDEFRERFVNLAVPGLEQRIVDPGDLRVSSPLDPAPDILVQPWDTHSYMLTSGTTGPSKLVNMTHRNSFIGADVFYTPWGLGEQDVFLVDLAMFHAGGFRFVHAGMGSRVKLSMRRRPSLDSYWEVARDAGVTASMIIGSMFAGLSSMPVRAAEKEHRIRLIGGTPLPADSEAFKERFGITHLHSAWGLTEVPAAVHVHPGITHKYGSTGVVREGYEVRLVDENDIEVPVGTAGQAIVRTCDPWIITHEYRGQPAATAEAWRNGWFHTGDVMRKDEDGYFYFVDRAKDVVRRRGENVSSFEVEAIILTHPSVAQAACVAARESAENEDEVKVWIRPANDTQVDLGELLEYCVQKLPHFMVPRYFEVAEAFPLTPTGKIEKAQLRAMGNGPATWDREAEGYSVTRKGLTRTGASSNAR